MVFNLTNNFKTIDDLQSWHRVLLRLSKTLNHVWAFITWYTHLWAESLRLIFNTFPVYRFTNHQACKQLDWIWLYLLKS